MQRAIHESTRLKHIDPAIWDNLEKRFYYVTSSFDDAAGYTRLAEVLAQCDRDWGTGGNYLYYLATAPRFFAEIAQRLGKADLAEERQEEGRGWRRIVPALFPDPTTTTAAFETEAIVFSTFTQIPPGICVCGTEGSTRHDSVAGLTNDVLSATPFA